MIPIAGVTNSGIQFFTLTQQFLRQLGREGFEDGWAFPRPDGSRAKASDYQDNIFQKLEIIQATTSLIDSGCSIWDEYGIQRSGRHFFTTRCSNMKVDKHDIELQCRWSTDRANGLRTIQWSMIHNYSEVRNMKQALIRPSKACWWRPLSQGFSPTWGGKPWVTGMDLVERDVVEIPSLSNLKVPFYFLGQALFGAISLANPI